MTPDLKKETLEQENERIIELLESFISSQEIASEIGIYVIQIGFCTRAYQAIESACVL